MPDVTVVVPAYNPGPLLRRALQSVVAQTFGSWECIVVDDGGDEDLTWVDSFHPQVRRLRQGNAGVSVARNMALQMASAGWVAYLDQDDEWLPTKLELQLASSAEIDLSYTAFEWV